MGTIPEFLKSNDHHLKFCILYEVALKKPIFDSYLTFCDAVGHDAMEYRDFEFWYYRFSQGELDLDYDRSMDPVPKTLMDMPVNLMRKITENLDPFERSSLRSTNRSIKELTDSLPSVFEKINIITSAEKMEWDLNEMRFECKNYGTSCSFSKSKVTKNYEGCYMKKSLEYLTPVFKMPNLYVNSLCLYKDEKDILFGQRRKMTDLDDLLSIPFHVKEVEIDGYDVKRVLHFLSYMTPGHLESIYIGFNRCLNIERENFEAIFETDQFKQAKEVNIDIDVKFSVEDLVNFSHLKRFNCSLESDIEPEDILQILEIVSTFEEFESCQMSFNYHMHRYPIENVAEKMLNVEIPDGNPEEPFDMFTHRFQIPQSNKHPHFAIEDEGHRCFININKIQ
ncbi:unnamed protein product [Caenorhabditis nigoni]